MLLNSVKYSCTSLAGVNKVGNLKKTEDGYYPLVVGALNVFNSASELYLYEEAKNLFESSSHLMRRVQGGKLRGEYGHPKLLPGQSQASFANRVLTIDEGNTCCHHRSIRLDTQSVRDAEGRPVIAIVSEVFPSGPLGHVLERSLNNPSENVCFSIRAFTDNFREGGLTKRILKTIVTWDLVNEPGISVAEKYQSPALEARLLEDHQFSRGDLERAISSPKTIGVATESVMLSANELFASMGWNAPSRPNWTNW